MTAPALGLETPEQKAARLAAEQKQSALTAPALSLAGQADQAAKTAGATAIAGPAAPTDKLTTTISAPKTGPQDRIALAQSAWDTSTAQSAPAYEASLRAAKQAAAGVGQLGSGMLRTTLGDLALTRQRDMDAERSALLNNAITGSIADNQFATGVDQQQQQFQSTEDARRFQQALDSQKVGLDTTLGLADVAIKQKQADANAQSVSGGLELQRAELVAKYGAAEADRMIEQQKVDAQKTQFGQSLQEQQAARLQSAGISQQEVDLKVKQLQQEAQLQGRSLSIQEAQNQATTQLEQARLTQQGQQFGQQMTLEQKKADLDAQVQTGQLSIAQANQQLNDWQAKNTLALEQQKVAQAGQQFTAAQSQQMQQFLAGLDVDKAKLALDQLVQMGQLSVAQANQALTDKIQTGQLSLEGQKLGQSQQGIDLEKLKFDLDRQVQLGQLSNAVAAQKLDEARVQNQKEQFGLSLAEQQASRGQQDAQFGQSNSTEQRGQTMQTLTQIANILGLKDPKDIEALLASGIFGGTPYAGAPPATTPPPPPSEGVNPTPRPPVSTTGGLGLGGIDETTGGATVGEGWTTPRSGRPILLADPTVPTGAGPTATAPATASTPFDASKQGYQGPSTQQLWLEQLARTGMTQAANGTWNIPDRATEARGSLISGLTAAGVKSPAIGPDGTVYADGMGNQRIGNMNDPAFMAQVQGGTFRAPAAPSNQSPLLAGWTPAAPRDTSQMSNYERSQWEAHQNALADGAADFGYGAGSLSSYQSNPNSSAIGAGAAGKVFGPDGMPMATPNAMTPEARSRLAAGWALKYDANGGVQYLHTPAVNSSTLAINNGTNTATAQDPAFQAYLRQLLGVA